MNHKIDLMIVGAQKAGTTSLKNYLGQHPEIITHLQTECSHFVLDDEYILGIEDLFRNYFPSAGTHSRGTVIAKNAAIYSNEKALFRLKQHNPDCIILFLIRHPVDRAFSSYLMEVNSGWYEEEWDTIKESIKKYHEGVKDQMFRLFIELGMYSEHLEKIYQHFPREQVMIVLFDELISQPEKVCTDVFKRLAIDESFKPNTTVRFNPTKHPRSKQLVKGITWLRFNNNPIKKLLKWLLPPATFIKLGNWVLEVASVSKNQENMAEETRITLLEFFEPYNKALSSMTGLNVSHWEK